MRSILRIIFYGVVFCAPIQTIAGTCIPEAVAVQVENSNKSVVFEGKTYVLDVVKYTADTKSFTATWIEEGDPAYELVILNKSLNSSCTIKNDQPFILFDNNSIFQGNNGGVVIMMEGIGSWFQSSFYSTATCERIGHIDDLYPNNAYIKNFFGKGSMMTIGGGTTYDLGDQCVPHLLK